jgi:hypothetical protein
MKPSGKKALNYKARQQRRKRMEKELVTPAAGWVIVVNRELRLGAWVYPRGSLIEDIGALGANAKKLFDAKAVQWCPPSSADRPKPRELKPTPAAPPVPKKITLVDSGSPIDDWRDTVAALARQLNGDVARATDVALRDVHGVDLFRRAQYEAGRRKVQL